MANATQISDLKRAHLTLYETAVRDQVFLLNDPSRLKAFVGQVDTLLGDVSRLSQQVTSVEDFDWLSDAALKWQFVFSSMLNLPKRVQPLATPDDLKPAAQRFWSPEDIDQWFERTAYQQSVTRKLNMLRQDGFNLDRIPSSHEEMVDDWLTTRTMLAAQVIEGKINFARETGPLCYHFLEEEWLSDVKRAKAYFIWDRREDRSEHAADNEADYYAACEEIRRMLERPEVKAPPEAFEPVRTYLEKSYLTPEGAFDAGKSEQMLRIKAYRASVASGEREPLVNWSAAGTYCRMFYGNIVRAVLDRDPESTLMVLKAFQYSKAPEHRYLIINCFEVALAIYFLDAEVIGDLWEEARDKPRPDRWSTSTAPVGELPGEEAVPAELCGKIRRDPAGPELVYEGVMSAEDHELLLAELPAAWHPAIEELFWKSRLLPRETTL